jgi:hypothetical protein
VSIRIDIPAGPAGIADRLRQQLEEQLKKNNNPIVENAAIQIVATATVGPEQKLLVKAQYPDTGEHPTTWRTVSTSLRLSNAGTYLWGSSRHYGGPGRVVLRQENQSYQEALNEAFNKAFDIFEKPNLPERIFKPVSQLGLNKSAMFPQ